MPRPIAQESARRISAFALTLLLLAACSDSSPLTNSSPVFEPVSCGSIAPFGQAANLVCGTVAVPENRSQPDSRAIRIFVAVLKSTAATPAPDPLVFLNGGPGASTTSLLIQAFIPSFARPVQEKRDIVLLDLRGTGLSEPRLACPAYDAAQNEWYSDLAGLNRALDALVACRDGLGAANPGLDLGAYTSSEIAADVRDAMAALGHPEWNLYGLSYGSRVALTALRDDPRGIRSVVLDSPAPPQANFGLESALRLQRLLERIFAACRAQPSCSSAFPGLEERFFALVKQLDAAPLSVELKDPLSGELRLRSVSGTRLLALLRFAAFDVEQIAKIPAVLSRVAAGDAAALCHIPGEPIGPDTQDQGAFFATWCAEEQPFYTPALAAQAASGLRSELALFGQGGVYFEDQACTRWGLGEPLPIENQAVASDVPALLLEGEYDANHQAPSYAATAAASLTQGHVVYLGGLPHAVAFAPSAAIASGRTTCAWQLTADFLDDPTHAPETGCVASLPGPAFATTLPDKCP